MELWKLFFDFELDKYGKDFLFHCNCSSQDIHVSNLFVQQVVQAWCEATYCIPICPDDVKRQLIWNNSFIKINKKIVFDRYLYDKGSCLYIHNSFDENGTPFTFENFTTNYDISNFLFTRYWGLINAIPKDWRVGGLGENRDIYLENSYFTETLNHRYFSQAAYNSYLEKISGTPTFIKNGILYLMT